MVSFATMKTLLMICVFQAFALLAHSTWVKEMENPQLFQGDIVLDPDERTPDGSVSYASMKGGRWPNGEVPYLIDSTLLSESKAVQAIKEAIADYHKYTCIRFKPRTDEQAYIHFYRGIGCNSPVGYKAFRVNELSLGKGCWHKGTTMHEMGHSMGFWHEQSRPDRDNYIKVLWDNIMPSLRYNFDKHTAAEIDSLGTPYDLESMMHYGTTAFSRNGGRSIKVLDYSKRLLIGQRRGFSNIDVKQLNLMYKCPVFRGTVPPKICKDTGEYDCSRFKRKGYCTSIASETAMYRWCCKTCFGDGTPITKPASTVSPTKAGSCVDKETEKTCRYWALLGNCESKLKVLREFMKKNCCATCRDHKRHR